MLSEGTEETGVTSGLGGEYTERMDCPRRHGPREPEDTRQKDGMVGWSGEKFLHRFVE